jgi:DNA-binding response OmpR family regulator
MSPHFGCNLRPTARSQGALPPGSRRASRRDDISRMRVLLVEDNPRLAQLIAEGLTLAGYVVDSAATLSEAEAHIGGFDFDLIVLDVRLPDGNGRDLLREVRRQGLSTPVLVATAISNTSHRIATLDDGADDYLGKPFDMNELLARVRAILRRPRQLASPRLTLANLALDLDRQTAEVDGFNIELSRRELNALAILLRSGGALVSRSRFEQALYASDEEVTPNALEAVVSRLRKRLDQAGAAVSITAMRGIGYILSERP